MKKKVVFKNFRGMDLRGVLTFENGESRPGVIISHGFLSYKENKLLFGIAQELFDHGFSVLRYDFSGCVGESSGTCEDIMLSHLVDDLIAAVNFMVDHEGVDGSRIGLVGHSLGGLTSLVVASRVKYIKSLVTVAAPANVSTQKLITQKMVDAWREKGVLVFPNDRRGEVKVDFQFYNDMTEYDGLKIAHDLRVPVRLVQGTLDNVVPLSTANELFDAIGGRKDLAIVEGGDHLLISKEVVSQVASLAADWMDQTLK